LDKKGQQEYIEIKKTATLKQTMLSTLKQFKPDNARGMLIYNGKTEKFSDHLISINYEEYLQD